MKKCGDSSCGEIKPVSCFSKNRARPDGYNHICKDCAKIRFKTFYEKTSTHPKRNWIKSEEDRRTRHLLSKRRFNSSKAGKESRARYKLRPEVAERRGVLDRAKSSRDIGFRLKKSLSNRVRMATRGHKPNDTTSLIGCSIEELREYLSAKFCNGMTWGNYGLHGWHIDHIRPCASFDLTNPGQQKACFHYTNLQPLWWHENLAKSDTWIQVPTQ